MNQRDNPPEPPSKEDLQEEREADPEQFEDKYGVDADKPYEPIIPEADPRRN